MPKIEIVWIIQVKISYIECKKGLKVAKRQAKPAIQKTDNKMAERKGTKDKQWSTKKLIEKMKYKDGHHRLKTGMESDNLEE